MWSSSGKSTSIGYPVSNGFSSEDICTNIMIQTEQVVVIDLGIYVCVQQKLMRKEAMDLKERKEGGMGRYGERNGNGERKQ